LTIVKTYEGRDRGQIYVPNTMSLTREEACDILDIPDDADHDLIRTSYKRLALKWHPDKHDNSKESTAKFQEISVAYKRLTDEDYDSEEEYGMTLEEMFDLFQQMFLARKLGAYCTTNGYDSSDEDDDDYDDDDDEDDDVDYLEVLADRMRNKQDPRKAKSDGVSAVRNLTAEEIETNAKDLVTEEDREKKKAEKRRAKKKRRREKKKMERAEQTKSDRKVFSALAVSCKVSEIKMVYRNLMLLYFFLLNNHILPFV